MRRLDRFLADKRGNMTLMFAFMFVLVALFAGGAVDFTRRNAVRADLIESLDAAGLAIAQLDESGEYTEAELKEYGEKFFHENFSHENQISNLSVDFAITEQKITPTATGEIKTLFLGLAGNFLGAPTRFDTLAMSTDTEITRRGSGPIELALVLDVTGSMSDSIDGVAKIESLRLASDALLDALYGDEDGATSDDVTTSVVPFNNFVGAGAAVKDDGSSAWNSDWNDADAEAYYHGANFLHVTSASAIDLNTKVNHFNLFDSVNGTDWAGCFEERPFPLDELDTAANAAASVSEINEYDDAPDSTNALVLSAFSAAPALQLTTAALSAVENSRFVPLFAPDDPDCDSSNECEWGTTNYTSAGITYKGNWFHDPENDSQDNDDYINSFVSDKQYTYRTYTTNISYYVPVVNYFRRVLRYHVGTSSSTCPTTPSTTQQNSALYSWLTARGASECYDDEYILRQAYVGRWNDATSTYQGKLDQTTSIDETISEASGDETTRGPNRGCTSSVLYGSNDKDSILDHINALAPAGSTNSAEGLMWGWRVLSPEAPFVSDIPYNDDKWQKAVVLMTDGFNSISGRDTHQNTDYTAYGFGREARLGSGINTDSEMEDEINNKLLRICTRMKEKGILVYAVTFGLSDSDPDEYATKQVFQACASDDEAPYYFDAPDGDELQAAFEDIASDLVQLHVSR
jgi:Flp pilus assembly protein TadG